MSLIQKARGYLKTEFVRVSSWSAVSTAVRMISGIVSVKVVASLIGPGGMALVGQFMNTITMMTSLGTGCIGLGVTKYVSEHREEKEKQQRVIATAVWVTLLASVAVSLLLLSFARPIGLYVFKTDAYRSLVILLGCTVILYAFNALLLAILNGFQHYRKFILINIVSSVAALLLSVALVISFGLYGALVNCVVSQSVVILFTLYFIRKEPWLQKSYLSGGIDRNALRHLGRFTLMAIVSAILVPLTQLVVRGFITNNVSLQAAGLWEGMTRISGMYLVFITTSIGTFYLPRLSELQERAQLRREIFQVAKMVLPALAVICLVIYLSRGMVVRILFSKEFLPMADLFGYQMIGDFFKIASWLLAYLFWAKAMTRHFIITEIVFSLLFIGLSVAGVKIFGLEGSVRAYALNYLLYFITLLFLFRELLWDYGNKKGSFAW